MAAKHATLRILICRALPTYAADSLDAALAQHDAEGPGWPAHRWDVADDYRARVRREACRRCGARREIALVSAGLQSRHWKQPGLSSLGPTRPPGGD